jgi:two-component system, sensor histidine kinase
MLTSPGSHPTILVVEDYVPNIMVITMQLEDLGYKSIVAQSGFQALEYVSNADRPFYAILMDVQMYEMDGLETTRRIRELEKKRNYRQKIIGVTAHALAGDRERCLAAGMDDYMTKPVYIEVLAEKLSYRANCAA